MVAHRWTTSPQQLPLGDRFHDTRLLLWYRPRNAIGRLSRGYMDDVTLVHIIPRDRLVLLELDSSLLIPLLVVLNPKRQSLGPAVTANGATLTKG